MGPSQSIDLAILSPPHDQMLSLGLCFAMCSPTQEVCIAFCLVFWLPRQDGNVCVFYIIQGIATCHRIRFIKYMRLFNAVQYKEVLRQHIDDISNWN